MISRPLVPYLVSVFNKCLPDFQILFQKCDGYRGVATAFDSPRELEIVSLGAQVTMLRSIWVVAGHLFVYRPPRLPK